jgi:hypothetical protein
MKQSRAPSCLTVDRQFGCRQSIEDLGVVVHNLAGMAQFAQAPLGRDFPGAGRTDLASCTLIGCAMLDVRPDRLVSLVRLLAPPKQSPRAQRGGLLSLLRRWLGRMIRLQPDSRPRSPSSPVSPGRW